MREKNKKEKTKFYLLNLVTFLLGFQLSLSIYIFSSFFKKYTGSDNIGAFYIIAYVASFYILINLHHLIKKYGKSNMLLLFMVMKILCLLALGVYVKDSIAIILAVWSMVSGALMWATFDTLIESFSKDKLTGRIRGLHLTFMDAGFILGPFISAWIVQHFGFGPVFIFSSFIMTIATSIVFVNFRNINHQVKRDPSILVALGKMIRRRDLMRIYYISLMLELFYCVMAVYAPLYLLSIGFSWVEIGKIITVMLIPFLILQFPLGIIADKHTGEKELLFVGIIIMAISVGAMSLITEKSLALWMGLFFTTRIGASIVQVMRSTYFYKKVNSQDVELIDFFRTTRSVAFVFGMTFFGIFLTVLPLQMVFLMLGILIFTALAPILRMNDTK